MLFTGDFECEGSFVINFAHWLCTIALDDPPASEVEADSPPLPFTFTFTKGSRTTGTLNHKRTFSVDGATPTTTVPAGVSFGLQFNDAIDFSAGVREMQTINGEVTVDIDTDDFTGNTLVVNVTFGLEEE